MVRLTRGDDFVFSLLFMCNVMTVDQIRRARYHQPQKEGPDKHSLRENVTRRLSKLRQAGYLHSEECYTEARRRILVYRLGERAVPELRLRNPLITQRRIYAPRERNAFQLLHAIRVSECAIRVIESLRSSDVSALKIGPVGIPFYHTRLVGDCEQKKAVRRYVTQEEVLLEGQRCSVRPDLVFALARHSKPARLFFLEADRGTEGHKALQRKMRGYHALSRSPERVLKGFGSRILDFRVLLVTTSQRRLQNIRSVCGGTPGADLVRLSTAYLFEDTTGSAIFDSIWLNATSGGRLPLMKR